MASWYPRTSLGVLLRGAAVDDRVGVSPPPRSGWIRFYFFDTSRGPAQTKYQKKITTYFPERRAVESLINEKGPYSFYDSVENRKEC